jgi:hypothetical protein
LGEKAFSPLTIFSCRSLADRCSDGIHQLCGAALIYAERWAYIELATEAIFI